MKNQVWIVAVVCSVVVLTGCHKATVNPLLISPRAMSQLDCRIQWQQPLELGKENRFANIQVAQDTLITLETNNVLTVMRTIDGKVIWQTQVGDSGESLYQPVRQGKFLLVASEINAYVYRIQNGEVIRKVALDYVAATGPVFDGNYAIFGSRNGLIFSQDLRRCFACWKYQMGASILVNPIKIGNAIIATDAEGGVASFNRVNGEIQWRNIGPPWKGITTQPVANATTVFVASEDRSLYAMDVKSGRFWKYLTPDPLVKPAVIMGNQIVLPVSRGLTALNAKTGEVIWERPDLSGTPITTWKNTIIISQWHRIAIIDRYTGNTLDVVQLPKVNQVVADRTIDGNMYLINNDGRIMKISPG